MKILMHSNAPWAPTGYGQQTNQLIRRLRDDGHDVAVSAFYGLNGTRFTWEGFKIYPSFVDGYGRDVLVAHAEDHFGEAKGGLVLTLIDVWVLPTAEMRHLNSATWVPVDHEPAPRRVVESIQQAGATPIAMSRSGQALLKEAGLDPLYAPHGIDTAALSPQDGNEWRDLNDIPRDAFVVGMVAANKGNPSRKGFEVAFQAFAKLRQKHEDAYLFCHTEATGAMQGVNLLALAEACGIPERYLRFTPQYHGCVLGVGPEHMAKIFSSFDVLVNPALGEGFGIPIVEAQACGVPVIVTDWTAMRELCGAGWKVGGQKTFTTQESWAMTASVDELHGALVKARKTKGQKGKLARSFAEGYDADKVYAEHWRPILAQLEAEIETQETKVAA